MSQRSFYIIYTRHLTQSVETCSSIPWIPKGIPDDGTCDVPEQVADLLTTGERILCM